MLLLFDDEHKKHLEFLQNVSLDDAREFINISMEYIRSVVDAKVIQSAAGKLKAEPTMVQKAIEGISFLLAESSKLMISDLDFHDSIMTLGFNDELRAELLATYQQNRTFIRQMLEQLALQLPQYHDLEWRVNVKVASRSLRGQITPNVLMRLTTADNDSKKGDLLECDIPNLVHLTNSLEEALQESKSQHTRRILRNIK